VLRHSDQIPANIVHASVKASICVCTCLCMGVCISLNVRAYICIHVGLNEREIETRELKEDDGHVDRSCCAILIKYLQT